MVESSNTYSGWVHTSDYTQVTDSFWNSTSADDPLYAGSFIAHEEQHHNGMDGPNHNKGVGTAYELACQNPQA